MKRLYHHSHDGGCGCHSEEHHETCQHHPNHEVLSSIDILKKAGLKYTRKRERMIRLFSQEDRYLSARQVQELLRDEFPNLSYDTIYRNLYTYVDLQILETTELSGEKLFRYRCRHHGHHHHFICEQCGRTKEIHMCPMDFFKEQLKDCQITSHRFEIFGLCERCVATA